MKAKVSAVFTGLHQKRCFWRIPQLKKKKIYENKTQFVNLEPYGPEKLRDLFSIIKPDSATG